ncbi:MAG: cyclic pyranopterin monophosphate synthase MoaC [Syntrophomonadaceae bacterium]|nr:cyclic pyranopterin monophosphate synthase MoaC [Syntrophomonadaceae bacterium]
MEFTHLNSSGRARMVDVSAKADSTREARAMAVVKMKPETLQAIKRGAIAKGDVLAVAQVAAIMGAKQTPQLIPMCHPLMLAAVDVEYDFDDAAGELYIETVVRSTGKTGVEMEAITAASIAALTIYDMCKAVDRWMEIARICLLEKSGGKSGYVKHPGYK